VLACTGFEILHGIPVVFSNERITQFWTETFQVYERGIGGCIGFVGIIIVTEDPPRE
jgi:hypothetical protein